MQSYRTSRVVVVTLLLSTPFQITSAMTFDYSSAANAFAEVGWRDYYGYYWDFVSDSNEGANSRSYASVYYDKIEYMGNIGASASAEAFIEPNEVTLSAKIAGSYRFDIGWQLMDYFYQDANSTIAGSLQITEFPAGTPCSLRVDVSFLETTWTGLCAWQVYIESSLGYFLAGGDELGYYGSLSGTVTAYAGEEIYVLM